MDDQTDKNPKRERDPLEGNDVASDALEAEPKRPRLAAEGPENQTPLKTHSGQVESVPKADTPAVSVRHRVQQLNQRQGGAVLVQHNMSDPGAASPSGSLLPDVCHIGEGEFSSRLERFESSINSSDISDPSDLISSTPGTRQLSRFVHNMQQQLSATETPSTKEASRIRQARENELKLLKAQPLKENLWRKRSASDPSLAERSRKNPGTGEGNRWEGQQHGAGSGSCERDETEFNIKSREVVCSTSFSGAIEMPGDDTLESVVQPNEEMNLSAINGKTYEDDKENREDGETGKLEKSGLCQTKKEEEPEMSLESPVRGLGGDGGEKNRREREEPHTNSEKEPPPPEEGTSECTEEEFLNLPSVCILSPLSKSLDPLVMPLAAMETGPPPTGQSASPEEAAVPPIRDAPPLYSVDAYRSQTKNANQASQGVTAAGTQKQVPEEACIKPPINTKETIKALNEEAARLQTTIHQTLQALSNCTDEEHGKGSLQEAEAEKLLLVSSEKHASVLAEISRLKQEAGAESNAQTAAMQPCRGTVRIDSIQLPLKLKFVCSARKGRPTHYFFVLIRYGSRKIVATPLATAADAENGDTIIFPTAVTLQDVRADFEINVEVYSLSNSASNTCTANVQQHRGSTRLTPRKLLSNIKKYNQSSTSSPSVLDSRRSSNFHLVGSHRITLASLGQTKFPLDKIKFEGKIRRLFGDEFQEKVPFLSPLEGHIYLGLHVESHSNVKYQGFLNVFENVGGFGSLQRLFFKLEGGLLLSWNHPSEMGNKPAEGSISLHGFDSLRPVERDSCARPHTFELMNTRTQEQDENQTLTKSWFSADTREERAAWMEKLGQVLLDLRTWSRQPAPSTLSNTAASCESFL